jgi:hypothetical protein
MTSEQLTEPVSSLAANYMNDTNFFFDSWHSCDSWQNLTK